jgi:hypothetical protein
MDYRFGRLFRARFRTFRLSVLVTIMFQQCTVLVTDSYPPNVEAHPLRVNGTKDPILCGSFAFYFEDPEGNVIEVFWPTGLEYQEPPIK